MCLMSDDKTKYQVRYDIYITNLIVFGTDITNLIKYTCFVDDLFVKS